MQSSLIDIAATSYAEAENMNPNIDPLAPLRGLKHKTQLADAIELFSFFDDYPINVNALYKSYKIESDRYIEQPNESLKIVQRRLHDILKEVPRPEYLSTFQSHVMNAKVHRKSKELLNLDIHKFFPSTSAGKIYKFFREYLQCSHAVSSFATELFSYRGHLPTGGASSPILGYWVNYQMWENINNICREFHCIFTLYMDDLTISGKKIDPLLEQLITKQLKRNRYVINEEKRMFYGATQEKEVTGVRILLDGTLMPSDKTYEKESLLALMLELTEEEEDVSRLMMPLSRINAYMNYIEETSA